MDDEAGRAVLGEEAAQDVILPALIRGRQQEQRLVLALRAALRRVEHVEDRSAGGDHRFRPAAAVLVISGAREHERHRRGRGEALQALQREAAERPVAEAAAQPVAQHSQLHHRRQQGPPLTRPAAFRLDERFGALFEGALPAIGVGVRLEQRAGEIIVIELPIGRALGLAGAPAQDLVVLEPFEQGRQLVSRREALGEQRLGHFDGLASRRVDHRQQRGANPLFRQPVGRGRSERSGLR